VARVFIPTLLRSMSGGVAEAEVGGGTVREVVDGLERLYPGIRDRLVEEGRLRPNISVAIDGEVSPAGLRERVGPDSEVHFVTAIRGG
jgi:molybdopterin converting factor small subunit